MIIYFLSDILYFNIIKRHEKWILNNGIFADYKGEKSFIEKTTEKIQTIKKESTNTSDELLKWAELKEKGLETYEEFQKGKEKILNGKNIMICEKCNNIIDEDSKFCTKCGERILVKAEELDTVFNNKNEQNKKYQKIGGFLIVWYFFSFRIISKFRISWSISKCRIRGRYEIFIFL